MRRDGIAFAARVGATGSVQTIVEGRARNLFTQTQLETAFITGAGAGHLPFVRFMLESDDVAVRAAAAENGALLAAAINGRLPVVRYLLDGGFDDVNIAANGYAVVYDALARRRRDVFLYLIARRDFPLLELEAELRRLGASVYASDFDAIVAARRKQ
jgi:ankyrin repeat protein